MTLFREPAYQTGIPPESAQYGMPTFVSESPNVPSQIHRVYMDGVWDDQTGDADGPGGHFYRVGEHVVNTDAIGRMSMITFATFMDADIAMQGIARQIDAMNPEED